MAEERVFNPIAAALAWAWPGAGHISLGQKRRGFCIMFGVLFLFVGGVLIGGVDSVDHRDDRLWFYAQAVCGPIALATDWINQSWIKPLPAEQAALTVGINKPNEMGTLFSALAGLMNLIVILDALFPISGRDEPGFVERRKTD